jgi:hypothetical protein
MRGPARLPGAVGEQRCAYFVRSVLVLVTPIPDGA